MWYKTVVPERGQPSTNTGAVFRLISPTLPRSGFFSVCANIALFTTANSCSKFMQSWPQYLPVYRRPRLDRHTLLTIAAELPPNNSGSIPQTHSAPSAQPAQVLSEPSEYYAPGRAHPPAVTGDPH